MKIKLRKEMMRMRKQILFGAYTVSGARRIIEKGKWFGYIFFVSHAAITNNPRFLKIADGMYEKRLQEDMDVSGIIYNEYRHGLSTLEEKIRCFFLEEMYEMKNAYLRGHMNVGNAIYRHIMKIHSSNNHELRSSAKAEKVQGASSRNLRRMTAKFLKYK
jgi:hypothetical protein